MILDARIAHELRETKAKLEAEGGLPLSTQL